MTGKAKEKVTVVIVTYNSGKVIGNCLSSIPKDVTVIITDNASSDNTVSIIRAIRPSATILEPRENLGFGRANNLALEKVTTEFAFILNPDTELEKDTIDNLLKTAKANPDAAIVAPALYGEDNKIQGTYKNAVFKREKMSGDFIAPSADLCAECVSGAAMLLKVRLFKNIGFFDPKIFLFYEDDDICLKARKAGYSIILTPDAKARHLMGRSSEPTLKIIFLKNKHMMWSRLYLEEKYIASAYLMAVKSLYFSASKALLYATLFNRQKTVKYLARTFGAAKYLFSH